MSEEPRNPWISIRVLVIALFMLACFGALGARLYMEQVVHTKGWSARVQKSSNVSVRIPSVRGEIRDRNGITLVANKTSYGVDFYLPEIVKNYREKHGQKVPHIEYRANIDEMPKDVQSADVVQILNTSVIPQLSKIEIARDYNAGQLDRHYRTNAEVPFAYLDDVSFDTVARLSANDADIPGVDVALRPVRQYIYGAFASHILGYVGAPEDINKEPDIKDFNYYQPDVVGRASVEKFCDSFLRGKPGRRILERTPKGKIGAELDRIPPVPGNHVYLTLDARIQMIVENTLRETGLSRAACVVVDPNNGDVLAMASVPNYDPNIFIPKISAEDQDILYKDPTKPGVNRCVLGCLPGSTFKAVTALSALHFGLPASKTFNCAGSISYGGRPMKCWIGQQGGQHGVLDMAGALKNSCNCYFFQLANSMVNAANHDEKVGLQQIELVGDALGLGQRSGLPVSGEEPGILPGPRYLNARGKAAMIQSSGNIANTSIGQGMVEASPLQMAMVCSTVANGGISYQPRLVHRVVDENGDDVRGEDGQLVVPLEPHIRANLRDLGIPPEKVEVVRRGMWKVVNEQGGTGAKARIKGVEVAGKTGTAQFKRLVGKDSQGRDILEKDNRVWFMCFAPYKQPKYVVVIMIEGAKSGGGVAAPVATKIMREALALDAGLEPKVAWVKKVDGKFEQINEMTIKDDGSVTKVVAAAFGGTDQRPGEEASTQSEEDIPIETRKNKAMHADVRPAADERGRVVPPTPAKKPNLLQRLQFKLFGPRQNKPQPTPAPGGRGR